MLKAWSNTLDRMWRENLLVNCGLKKMWNWYEILLGKFEGNLPEDLRTKMALWGKVLTYLNLFDTLFTYIKASKLDREKVHFNITNSKIFR